VKTMAAIPGTNVHRIHGWLVSLALHGLLLSATLPLFRHVPIITPAEPFRWDVTLVQSTHLADEPIQAAEAREQHVATSTKPVPAPADVNNPFQTASSSATRLMPSSAITETAVVTEPQRKSPSPVASPAETASIPQETAPVRHIVTEEPTPSISASENQPAYAFRTSDPSIQQPKPNIASTIQERPVPTTVATSFTNITSPPSDFAQSALLAADVATTPTQLRDTSPVQSSPTSSETSGQPSVSRADYSWLQQAVSRRLEELKRSSRPSLDDASKLKVLVKAVVSNTGELMEAEVVKSSGLERIDQEAVTLVERAFPMPLDHALDRQQIVMRIPITYSRD
jgi:TonB family protein